MLDTFRADRAMKRKLAWLNTTARHAEEVGDTACILRTQLDRRHAWTEYERWNKTLFRSLFIRWRVINNQEANGTRIRPYKISVNDPGWDTI